MFFITNTRATANLERTVLKQSGAVLVNVTSSRWGKTGANGGDFTLNTKQVLTRIRLREFHNGQAKV